MRKSNRVEDKVFTDLPLLEQMIAANFGAKAHNAGPGAWKIVSYVFTALSIFWNNKPGPLAKAVEKDGWQAMLRPPPGDADTQGKLFYDQAAAAIVAIMGAVAHAVKTKNASDIRHLADAIESGAHGMPHDPLASYFLGLFECTPATGNVKKQTRVPTANEAHDYLAARYPNPPDIKTIYRRAAEMGVELKGDKRGAPPGKRKPVHRADG